MNDNKKVELSNWDIKHPPEYVEDAARFFHFPSDEINDMFWTYRNILFEKHLLEGDPQYKRFLRNGVFRIETLEALNQSIINYVEIMEGYKYPRLKPDVGVFRSAAVSRRFFREIANPLAEQGLLHNFGEKIGIRDRKPFYVVAEYQEEQVKDLINGMTEALAYEIKTKTPHTQAEIFAHKQRDKWLREMVTQTL
jgi:hypothetical protein